VAFFAEAVLILGLVPKSVGQIYGLLFASPEPLSFSDIVERLDISKGSASQGLQLLRSLGAVKPVSRSYSLTVRQSDRATTRDDYKPELGLRRLLGGIIRSRIEPLVGQGRVRMKHLRELAQGAADSAHKEFQLERVEQLETWRRQATLVMPVLKTLLASPHR
jgi:DNA-binding transcriptional regulator GbsR (MarR family)